ncbi:MAG: cysteine hydrolase [Catenulispora sp.]|nr:cysteine hydrolase [Catenulispora sp.]
MNRTALIVGDLQAGIVDNYAFAAGVVPAVQQALSAARDSGIPVVFIRFGLLPSGLDLGEGNTVVRGLHAAGDLFHDSSPETLVHPSIAPLPGETVVLKRRASAFSGTDLDRVLRAQGVDRLVVTGVATSAMVAATVYDAADRDYGLTVLSDGCADAEQDVHDFLVGRIFPARGVEVLTSAEWAARR